MKNIENFEELSLIELKKVQGGWIVVAGKIIGALIAGFSIGYGWGSYDCDCDDLDGYRYNEVGPTHNRA